MSRRPFNPAFWTLAQLGSRVRVNVSAALDITTAELPAPETVLIPTRHGQVRAVVYRPRGQQAGAPVVMHLHGGGFINRYPEQDRHFARYLAAELSAVVVLPDYDTAPKVRYPVAEEEMLDVARWIQASGQVSGQVSGQDQGWDGERLLLSGVSAGAKLAINVCQQLHLLGETRPLAVALTVPVTDNTGTPRTSPIARPAISPFVLRMVAWAYFPDADRRGEALASPRFDESLAECMPPTIVQTGAHDSLAAEGAELARTLSNAGVEVVHHEYPGADHGFYSSQPVENVRRLLVEIGSFFQGRLSPGDHV